MCLKEIGLCAQNLFTILGSVVNINVGGGWPLWSFNKKKKFTMKMEIFIWAPKIVSKMATGTIWIR